MICQSFLFPSKVNSNRLVQSNANHAPTLRGAAQHGAESKVWGSPGLTTMRMPPGREHLNRQANFYNLCSYSLFAISITCLLMYPFCLVYRSQV